NVSRRKTQEKHGIDQRVRVVEDEDDRRIKRDVFDTRNLDALKVNPQRQSHNGDDDAANHSRFRVHPACPKSGSSTFWISSLRSLRISVISALSISPDYR